MNRTLQYGIDAFKALGQEAPKELQKIATEVQKQQKAIATGQKGLLGGASGVLGGASKLLGGLGITVGVSGVIALGKSILDTTGQIEDLHQATGIARQELQKLGAVGKDINVPMEQMGNAALTLSDRLASGDKSAASAVEKLGLNVRALVAAGPLEAMLQITDAAGRVADPMEKAAIASELFGDKLGKKLIPLFGELRSGMDNVPKGSLFSDKDIQDADRLADKLNDISTILQAGTFRLLRGIVENNPLRNEGPTIEQQLRALPAEQQIALVGLERFNAAVPPRTSDISLNAQPAPLSREDLLNNRLAALRTAANEQLSASQRKIIAELSQWGESEKEIATLVGASEAAVARYVAAIKSGAAAIRPFNDAMEELSSATGNYLDIVDTVDGTVAQSIRFYLQAGVSQNALAAAYGLTATQVKAVATQMEAEQKAQKGVTDLNEKIVAQRTQLLASSGRDLLENLKIQNAAEKEFWQNSQREALSGTQFQLAQVDRWVVEEKAKLDKRATNYQAASDAIERTAQQRRENIQRDAALEEVKIRFTFVGPELSPDEIRKNTPFGDRVAGDIGKLFSGGEIGKTIIGALQGGGGLSGGLQAAGSLIGSQFTQNIGESLAKSMKSKTGDLLAGIIGPLGSLVGPMIAGLGRLISGAPEWQKFQKDVGRDLGVNISDGLAQQLEADSARFGRQAASLLNLDRIIGEAGGVQAFGTDKAIAKTRDLFSLLETGQLSVEQVGGTFDTVFADLIPNAIDKATGLASRSFVELQQLADRFGITSDALSTFRQDQVRSNVLGGLQGFLGSGQRIGSQASASALGDSFSAGFAELSQQGVPLLDLFKELDPLIGDLTTRLDEAGLGGGSAFDTILQSAALVKDEIAGPALQSVQSLGQVLAGLSNTGLLTQDTFSGLSGQIAQTFADLTAQGKGGDQALRLMQPTLQTIFELQQDFGFAVDDATQELLDQAIAAGIVGDKHKSAQKQIQDAMERTNTILEAIANVLGAKLPDAARRGADGVNEQLAKIEDPTIKINVDTSGIPDRFEFDYDIFGRSADGAATGGLVQPWGVQHFMGGGKVLPFIPKGTDTVPAMLTPGEVVLNAAQQEHLSNAISGAQASNQRPMVVQMVVGRRVLAETLVDSIGFDDAGVRRVIKKVAGAA